MLKLTHTTTSEEISRSTKQEILEVIEEAGVAAKWMEKAKKSELVEQAIHHRNHLIVKHEDEEALAAARRNEQLEADRQDTTYVAVQHNLLTAVNKQIDEKKFLLEETKTELADASDLVYVMRKHFETTAKTQWQLRELNVLARYITESTDQTKAEFLSVLKEEAEESVRRVLNSTEYEHRSTCQMSNLRSAAEFSGMQWKAKFIRQVVKLVEEAFESNDAGNLRFSFYL